MILNRILSVVLVLSIIIASTCFGAELGSSAPPLSGKQWSQLSSLAVDALNGAGGVGNEKFPRAVVIKSDLGFDRSGRTLFFISRSDGMSQARVTFAEGPGLNAAFSACLAKLNGDTAAAGQARLIKMHLGENLTDLGIFNEFLRYKIVIGIDGLAVAAPDGKVAYAFLPEEIWANDLVSSSGKINVPEMTAYLIRTGRNGIGFSELLGNLKTRIFRFGVDARFYHGGNLYETFRGHRLYPKIAEGDLRSSLTLAGKYLAGIVEPTGKFLYLYKPDEDVAEDDYNIVRHAGTVYAMMELYQHDRNRETLAAAKRAIVYLQGVTKPCPPPDRTALCVVEDNHTKLGANGLTAVALAKYTEATADRQYLKWMDGLCGRIAAIQKKTGEFYPHKQAWPGGQETTDFVSGFYPGEAILALTRVYSHDRNERWLDVAEAASTWLITVRDQGKTIKSLDHDHWLLYGLNELYRFRKKALYLEHARKIVDSITSAQILQAEYPDWVGSYAFRPKSTQVATRSEGLMAAWRLFSEAGDTIYAKKALLAADRGVRFQLATQIREETAMYFPVPRKVLGGFAKSFDDHEIQIDNVQHNVSAILALLNAYSSGREMWP
jgi:hypothetical protein